MLTKKISQIRLRYQHYGGGTRQGGYARDGHRDDRGFGLIEVIVALSVLMIAIVPLELLITTVTKQAAQVREKVTATGVAEQWLEHYNNLPLGSFPANMPATVTEPTSTLGGITYQPTVQLQWAEAGLSGNLCTPGSTPQVVSAIATVTWGSKAAVDAGYNQVQEQTVINPPYGVLGANQGFLAIQVNDATGALTTPNGQTVTATITPSPYTGGGPSTAITVPARGCIFTTANNGTYTVALSGSGTGNPYLYVDNAEKTLPQSVPLIVTPGATTSDIMVYDQGGAIGLSYDATSATSGGLACPTPSTCFAWGWGSGGAADLMKGTPGGGFSLVGLPSGVLAITGVSCPTTSLCYVTGIRSSNAGMLLSDNNGTLTAITLPVPSTAMAAVACLNSSTCYATGTNGNTGAVLVSISGTTATNAMPTLAGLTVSTLAFIECSNSNNCIATGSGVTVPTVGSPTPTAVVLTTAGPSWSASAVPAGVTAASSIACDPFSGANPPICIVAVQAGQPNVMASSDDGATWVLSGKFPAGISTIGPMACTGPTNCVVALQTVSVAGTSATTASTTDGTTWTADTGWPVDLQLITGLTCPAATECVASAVGSSTGEVATNTALGPTSAGTWSTLSSTASSFLSGIGCTSSASCLTVGGSSTGPVAYMTSDSGASWSVPSVGSNFAGLAWTPSPVTGLPITVSNGLLTGTQKFQPVAAGGPADSTLIPNLFPFSSSGTQPDYGVWAGDLSCLNEVPDPADLVPIPVTSGTTLPASIPLSPLSLVISRLNGTPVSGAQVTLTVATPGCPADTFGVPTSTSAGLVEVGIPTGTTANGTPMIYSVTVSEAGRSSSATLAIGPTGIVNQTTGLSYPYPSPVPFLLNVP